VPDLFHIVPVGDDTMLNRVLQGEDTTLGLGFVTDVGVTLFHANHDSGLPGTADQRREYGSRGIVSCKSGYETRKETRLDQNCNSVAVD
jgi:hypothetical protein